MIESELIFSHEILSLLTALLYPEPKMAIREILTNAADALTEAQGIMPHGEIPSILIIPSRTEPPTLTIEDNGIGISEEEVGFLNKVGSDADKRKRFENHLLVRGFRPDEIKEELANLIGRYGIGRLASLCIAKKVIIQSKSRKSGNSSEGIEWALEEGRTKATLEIIKKDAPGTKVILYMKDEYCNQVLLEEELEKIIREYGIFLPYRINIGKRTSDPVNIENPVLYEDSTSLCPIRYRVPVERKRDTVDSPEFRYQKLWDDIYGNLHADPPITLMPLTTEQIHGMLFIPSDSDFSETARVRLWCKRIFVKNNEDDLLPTWCRPLISGILDCSIDPNLSRTDLIRSNKEYTRLKGELEKEIVRQLGILSNYGDQWKKVLSKYRFDIICAANVKNELLEQISDKIPFNRAISVRGKESSVIDLETYKRQMGRRR